MRTCSGAHAREISILTKRVARPRPVRTKERDATQHDQPTARRGRLSRALSIVGTMQSALALAWPSIERRPEKIGRQAGRQACTANGGRSLSGYTAPSVPGCSHPLPASPAKSCAERQSGWRSGLLIAVLQQSPHFPCMRAKSIPAWPAWSRPPLLHCSPPEACAAYQRPC